MNIFERTKLMINNWRIDNYGEIPNRIFLGHKELNEARISNDYFNYCNPKCTSLGNEYMFGIKVQQVCEENYLSVGKVIEETE